MLLFFIRKNKNKKPHHLWIHLYARFGGLQSAVKGLSRNFLVPRSGINGAARPQEAQCTLGRRPQAAASPVSPPPSPQLGRRAGFYQQSRTRGECSRKGISEGPGPRKLERRGITARSSAHPARGARAGGGTWSARGSRGWGRGRSLRP